MLVLPDTKAVFDISWAFSTSQPSEGHAQILIETKKLLNFEVVLTTIDVLMESVKRKIFYDLREVGFPVHMVQLSSPRQGELDFFQKNPSNR